MVSVIVPIYNVEKYLVKCLDSIVNQTYKKLEIILIDDGSHDSSFEICSKYAMIDDRIKLISKENEGAGVARNLAISLAKGEYITFIDSDDWVDLDLIKTMKEEAEKYDLDIVTCDLNYVELMEDSTYVNIVSKLRIEPNKILKSSENKELINTTRAFLCGKLYKTSFLKSCNIIQPSHAYEDTCTIPLIIAKSEKLLHVDKALYFYFRNREGNVVTNPKLLKYMLNSLEQLKLNFDKNGLFYDYYDELKMFAYSQVRAALKKYTSYCKEDKLVLEFKNKLYKYMDVNFKNWQNLFESKILVIGSKAILKAIRNLTVYENNIIYYSSIENYINSDQVFDFVFMDADQIDLIDILNGNEKLIEIEKSNLIDDNFIWGLSDWIFYEYL